MVDTAGIHFNPSTLKVSYDETEKKAIVDSRAFGLDCCCFIDPDITEWDADTEYDIDDFCHSEGACYRAEVVNRRVSPSAYVNYNNVYKINFDTGVVEPDTTDIFNIVGSSSDNAKFCILSVTVTSGTWAGGDAAGYMLIYGLISSYEFLTIHSIGDDIENDSSVTICNTTSTTTYQYELTYSDYWTQVSTAVPASIDNGVWQTGGYGGFGRTPKYMTVNFDGNGLGSGDGAGYFYNRNVPHNPGINGTYILAQTDDCEWYCQTNPYSKHGCWRCTLNLCGTASVVLEWTWSRVWRIGDHYYDGGEISVPDTVTLDGDPYTYYRCKSSHTATANNMPGTGSGYWGESDEWVRDTENALNWIAGEAFNGESTVSFYTYIIPTKYPSGYYAYYSGQWYQSTEETSGSFDSGAWSACGTPNIMLNGCQFNYVLQNSPHAAGNNGLPTWDDCTAGGTVTITPGVSARSYTTWSQETEYSAGDLVEHDGVLYYCINSHTSYPDATTWLSTSTYSEGDYVLNDDVCYISKADANTNHEPPNATWWDVVDPDGNDVPGVGDDWEDYWDLQSGC